MIHKPKIKKCIEKIILTAIGFCQIEETSVGVCSVLHNFLNFFFTQHAVLHTIVGLNHYNSDGPNTQKVSDLERVRRRRVLAIAQQAASSRVTRKCLRSWDDPKGLGMSSHQQLTGTSVRQLVTLEFPSHVHGIFGTNIDSGGVAIAIGTLNNDSL